MSLHKYLYAQDDPVNLDDPSGNDADGGDLGGGLNVSDNFNIKVGSILGSLSDYLPVASESGLGSFASYKPRISSKAFWNAYAPVDYDKDHIPEGQKDKVWLLVGGSLDVNYGPPKDNDTCATRMSYALNRSGLLIPYIPDVTELNRKTVVDQHGKAGDGYRYIVGARQMGPFLKSQWGPADSPAVTSMSTVTTITTGLQSGQVAIFAGSGHTGAIKAGYKDPFIQIEFPVDVWILSSP